MAIKTQTAAELAVQRDRELRHDLDHYTETVQTARQIAETQRKVRLGMIGANTGYLAVVNKVSKDDLQRAYDLMHEALTDIVEGGPWRCVNRAEEALEDLWEIIKEDGHG